MFGGGSGDDDGSGGGSREGLLIRAVNFRTQDQVRERGRTETVPTSV